MELGRMIYKNVLVVRKTSKLNYLLRKYDISKLRASFEYDTLVNSSNQHEEKSEYFINTLKNYENNLIQNVEVVNDFSLMTDNNTLDIIDVDFSEYDLVFSLGGDGTFLRTSYFLSEKNKMLIGVNTDSEFSYGHYCALNRRDIEQGLNENLRKILTNDVNERLLDQHVVKIGKNKRYYFTNDFFFGEKHLGSVTKYKLIDEKHGIEQIIKSSGILCSTFTGYSGWIKFSNSITKNKFDELIKNIGKECNLKDLNDLSKHQLLKMYDKDYIPDTKDQNSVFYYVREPHISINMLNNLKMVEDYMRYLECLEGISDKISLQSFGFDSFFVLDGFFEVPVSYHDIFEVSKSDKKLRTIYKF